MPLQREKRNQTNIFLSTWWWSAFDGYKCFVFALIFFFLPSINSFAPVLNRDCVCKEKPMNWNVKNKYSWLWLTGKQHCWGGNCFIDTLPNNMWNFTYPSTSIVSGMRKTFNGRVNIYKFGWFLWLYSRKWQHRITLVDFFFLKEHQAKRKNDQKVPRYILQYFLFSNKHKETVSTMNEFNVVLNEDDVRTL